MKDGIDINKYNKLINSLYGKFGDSYIVDTTSINDSWIKLLNVLEEKRIKKLEVDDDKIYLNLVNDYVNS